MSRNRKMSPKTNGRFIHLHFLYKTLACHRIYLQNICKIIKNIGNSFSGPKLSTTKWRPVRQGQGQCRSVLRILWPIPAPFYGFCGQYQRQWRHSSNSTQRRILVSTLNYDISTLLAIHSAYIVSRLTPWFWLCTRTERDRMSL
jgi:hypothetical protein